MPRRVALKTGDRIVVTVAARHGGSVEATVIDPKAGDDYITIHRDDVGEVRGTSYGNILSVNGKRVKGRRS